MKKIIIIGNGGHSKVIQEMIRRTNGYLFRGILDQSIEFFYENNNIFYDNTTNIQNYINDFQFVVAIGDNDRRRKVIETIKLPDKYYTSIIDETSVVASDVKIDLGTVVMPNVVINPGTSIGKHSIINSNAVIEHDNIIGDFVHVSPNATLAGTVTVGDYTHLGAGAIVIPNQTVFENSVIGAGAVVTEDIEENSVAVGVPAKAIKRRF